MLLLEGRALHLLSGLESRLHTALIPPSTPTLAEE
jgi:hypothetical protein